MGTFSINTGTSTEAIKYDLRQKTEVDVILNLLPDNDDKEINPHNIRDAILSDWSNSAFKQTTASGSSISYIGIDTLNPDDKDTKNKILLGKRDYNGDEILGTYSGLLNGDSDIFFYNTKIDSISNYETKISILTGTNSSLYSDSPYLQSQIISGTTQSLSLDIVNTTGGTISFYNNSGSFSVNNIIFPTATQSGASSSNNKVLKWEDGKLTWNDIIFPNTNPLGTTGSELNIYGDPVNVNGYSIEFTESRECPISIGDIVVGSTFNSMSIADVLRRMIYTYMPPTCLASILPPYSSGYVEVGTTPAIKVNYTINKKTLPTQISTLNNMIPGVYPAITTSEYVSISGTSTGIYIAPIQNATSSFTVNVSDGTHSASASAYIRGIYPYFHGFSTLSTMTTAGLSSLTKLVESKSDKTIDLTGYGNFYFIYDNNYPILSDIIDNDGSSILAASFSSTTLSLSSPTGLWASKQFKVYQWNGAPQIGPPSVNYQFKY